MIFDFCFRFGIILKLTIKQPSEETKFVEAQNMDLKKNSKKQKKMIPRESGTPQNPSKTKIIDLPDEILESIFLKLSEKDVHRNLVLVCQRFKNIIYDVTISILIGTCRHFSSFF